MPRDVTWAFYRYYIWLGVTCESVFIGAPGADVGKIYYTFIHGRADLYYEEITHAYDQCCRDVLHYAD